MHNNIKRVKKFRTRVYVQSLVWWETYWIIWAFFVFDCVWGSLHSFLFIYLFFVWETREPVGKKTDVDSVNGDSEYTIWTCSWKSIYWNEFV